MNDEAPKSEPIPTEARSFVAKVKAVGGLIGNLTALVAALAALTKSCQHDTQLADLNKGVKDTQALAQWSAESAHESGLRVSVLEASGAVEPPASLAAVVASVPPASAAPLAQRAAVRKGPAKAAPRVVEAPAQDAPFLAAPAE